MTDGKLEASLWKIRLIKNQHKLSFFIFLSQISDSFVNHFDGNFAYLKTLDFSFEKKSKKIWVLLNGKFNIYLHPQYILHPAAGTLCQLSYFTILKDKSKVRGDF